MVLKRELSGEDIFLRDDTKRDDVGEEVSSPAGSRAAALLGLDDGRKDEEEALLFDEGGIERV